MSVPRVETANVLIKAGDVKLEGELNLPEGAGGVVIFVHGSGSSRHSPTEPTPSMITRPASLLEEIAQISHPLESGNDLDPLMDLVGAARYVLLGEASHGTSEYFQWRVRLSQRLIREKGFSFICIEGDWPDCYRVNRFIKGYPDAEENAREVLQAFERWPTWMWANWEIVALVEWMRATNQGRSQKIGFYGLDVYSLWESMEAILNYL